MCIIVVKNKGVKMPSKETLKICFENNPDGAGFMFNFNNRVYISKGYMTFDDFESAINKVDKKVNLEKCGLVMHFRISTQGGVNKKLCHPYPLSDNMKHLKKLFCKCNIGIAHNGIIDLTSSYYKKNIDHNDTMEFITDYLSLIIRNKNYYKDEKTLLLIERLCGSRLAILDTDAHIELIGEGWNENQGIWYSNTSWKEEKVKPSKYFGYGSYSYKDYGWCDDDFDYNGKYNSAYDYDLLDKSNKINFKSEFEFDGMWYYMEGTEADLENYDNEDYVGYCYDIVEGQRYQVAFYRDENNNLIPYDMECLD